MQLLLAHLPDEHLEQAANHEQRVVGLPDEQLTAEEKQNKNITFKVKCRTVTQINAIKRCILLLCRAGLHAIFSALSLADHEYFSCNVNCYTYTLARGECH